MLLDTVGFRGILFFISVDSEILVSYSFSSGLDELYFELFSSFGFGHFFDFT